MTSAQPPLKRLPTPSAEPAYPKTGNQQEPPKPKTVSPAHNEEETFELQPETATEEKTPHTSPSPISEKSSETKITDSTDQNATSASLSSEEDIVNLWKTVPEGWVLDTSQEVPLLYFNRGEEIITTVPLEPELMADLVPALNQTWKATPSETDTTWEVLYPDTKANPPVLALKQDKTLLASLPLTAEILTQILPTLSATLAQQTNPNRARLYRILGWLKGHKILSAVLILIISPLAIATLVSVIQQIPNLF